jgi:hypothetical protein
MNTITVSIQDRLQFRSDVSRPVNRPAEPLPLLLAHIHRCIVKQEGPTMQAQADIGCRSSA